MKYNTPIASGEDNVDPLHNTVEVKEWDKKPPPAHLCTNFIQLLEERGVPRKFFLSLAKKEIDELLLLSKDYDLLMRRCSGSMYLIDSPSIFGDDG